MTKCSVLRVNLKDWNLVKVCLLWEPSTRAALAAAWSLALFLVRVGFEPCRDRPESRLCF